MLYNFVLYLHITVAFLAFGLGIALHFVLHLLHRADSVGQVRLLVKPLKLGPVFGVFDLLLLGLGMWLIGLSKAPDKFDFGDPFVWSGIAVIAYLLAIGPTILERYAKRVTKAAEEAPDGPVGPELRADLFNRRDILVFNSAIGVFLAVVFNMANKPSAWGAILAVVVGVALGVLLAMPLIAPATSKAALVEETA
ncbi:MAG: hypothetical protein ACTHJM_06015 [Marmoricola sp.]